MAEIKPNSHKYRKEHEQQNKQIQPVIDANVVEKKKKLGHEMVKALIADDISDIKTRFIMDNLIPTIQSFVLKSVNDVLSMLFYGRPAAPQKKNSIASVISYRQGDYTDYTKGGGRPIVSDRTSRTGYEDLTLTDQDKAKEVLYRMDEIIETYDSVSVADLYQLCNITPSPSDFNYGWTDISTADVVRVRDGWTIKMPRIKVLR